MDAKYKRMMMASLLAVASIISGCGGSSSQQPARETGVVKLPEQNNRRVYFAYDDPRYDDKGPGRYRYPVSFNNREGFMDITRFTVEDGGSNVVFTINCRRPIEKYADDGSTGSKGWWLQMMDIYIDKDGKTGHGAGYTKALPGRQVEFDGGNGWEKMVLVTPSHSETVRDMLEERTSDMELVHQRKNIVVPHRAYPQGYTFVVYVPKHEIGTPQPGWGYQVLMVPYDEGNMAYGHFQNQKINKFSGDYTFGGGTDFDGNPNVMDILAPSAQEQYRILSNYHSAPYAGNDRLAKVPFIYSSDVKGSFHQSFNRPQGPAETYESSVLGGGSVKPAPVTVPGGLSEQKVPSEEKNVSSTGSSMPNSNLKVHSFEGGF